MKYAQCHNCGTIHYVLDEKTKDFKSDTDGFEERNLKHCSQCGSKNLMQVSKYYASAYLDGNKLYPILLDDKNEEPPKKES